MYGSTLSWQLTVLFRGLIRPSSPACPKASTSCPESLIASSSYLSVDLQFKKLCSLNSSPIRRSPSSPLAFVFQKTLRKLFFVFLIFIGSFRLCFSLSLLFDQE